MGFVNSLFVDNETVSAAFKNRVVTNTAGTIDYTWTDNYTVDALFWTGLAAESVVSERLKPNITGVIVIDYEDYQAVNEDDKVTIDGVDFAIVNIDNVANQNKVIQIAVKEFN